MLTVYCEKMTAGASISPGAYGLAGVVIGALISGGGLLMLFKGRTLKVLLSWKQKSIK